MVTGQLSSNIDLSLPDNMTEGLQPDFFEVAWDEAGIKEGVRQAMQLVQDREGASGVVILGTLALIEQVSWIKEGINAVGRPEPLVYTIFDNIDEGTLGAKLIEWLHRSERGEETRDLLACPFVSRGWEARTVVVLDCGNLAENLALRAVSRLVVVRKGGNERGTVQQQRELRKKKDLQVPNMIHSNDSLVASKLTCAITLCEFVPV